MFFTKNIAKAEVEVISNINSLKVEAFIGLIKFPNKTLNSLIAISISS